MRGVICSLGCLGLRFHSQSPPFQTCPCASAGLLLLPNAGTFARRPPPQGQLTWQRKLLLSFVPQPGLRHSVLMQLWLIASDRMRPNPGASRPARGVGNFSGHPKKMSCQATSKRAANSSYLSGHPQKMSCQANPKTWELQLSLGTS